MEKDGYKKFTILSFSSASIFLLSAPHSLEISISFHLIESSFLTSVPVPLQQRTARASERARNLKEREKLNILAAILSFN
jgi:hypothetical protein